MLHLNGYTFLLSPGPGTCAASTTSCPSGRGCSSAREPTCSWRSASCLSTATSSRRCQSVFLCVIVGSRELPPVGERYYCCRQADSDNFDIPSTKNAASPTALRRKQIAVRTLVSLSLVLVLLEKCCMYYYQYSGVSSDRLVSSSSAAFCSRVELFSPKAGQ